MTTCEDSTRKNMLLLTKYNYFLRSIEFNITWCKKTNLGHKKNTLIPPKFAQLKTPQLLKCLNLLIISSTIYPISSNFLSDIVEYDQLRALLS